jgi:hypothetical protein
LKCGSLKAFSHQAWATLLQCFDVSYAVKEINWWCGFQDQKGAPS